MTLNLYDEVAYPTAIFPQTHPDRMAVIARLAGLSPPPVATARVLEIGGGDGMNLIAMAVSHPAAEFVNFDLAEAPIARGQAWVDRLGLSNCRMQVLDILDAVDRLEGEFDYIIAHGVYAWVPPPVREALMALIGTKLSANGVAFTSYNALPGGYLRLALRDALLAATAVAQSEAELHELAQAKLEEIANPPGDSHNAFQLALRDAALKCQSTRWAVLRHDELGPFFYPQALTDVVAAASAQGLRFLGDADRELMDNVFLPDHMSDLAGTAEADKRLIAYLADKDHEEIRFFRQTLLVRDSVQPHRRIDSSAIAGLLVTTQAEGDGSGQFQLGNNVFEVRDEKLSRGLARLVEVRPLRLPASEIADSPERLEALFQMFDGGLVDLHTEQAPAATSLAVRPRTSPLVRMMLEEGMQTIATLDHRLLGVTDADPRTVLALLDGEQEAARLLDDGPIGGLDTPDKLAGALAKCLREGLLMPD